jgi:hypothetical protein
MTVSELKEVVEIDVSGIEIKDLDEFTITFVDSSGNETNIDDCGTYDVIKSTICGDTHDEYFVFIARGLGENELTYGHLNDVLNDADDNSVVHLLMELQSIPPVSGSIISIESAVLDVTILEAVSEGGNKIKRGVLTLRDTPPICSSSSSSSSSSS